MTSQDDKQPESLADQIARIRANFERKGSSDDYAPPNEISLCRPDCPECGGIGYFKYDVPIDHPDFGKLFACPNSAAWKVIGERSGLDKPEYNLDWGNLLMVNDDIRNAKQKAEALLSKGYGWLTLWGMYGNAKTLTLKIMTAAVLRQKRQAVYIRMTDLLDYLRSAYDTKTPNEQSVTRLDWLSEVYCLAIDEFDRINATAWASERRFALMDRRYELATKRQGITILAMNANPNTLDGYLADRMFDGRFEICRVTNASLRAGLTWEDQFDEYAKAYEPSEHDK